MTPRHSSDKVEADIRRQMEKASSSDFGPLFTESPSKPLGERLRVRLHHDVETSQAAEKRQQERIGANARKVLAYLKAFGPSTRNELEQGTGIRINVICSTVAALRERGLIVQLEETRDGGHLLRSAA